MLNEWRNRDPGLWTHTVGRIVYRGALLAATFPAIFMLRAIVEGSHMQYNDYFHMVEQIFSEEGNVVLGGLLVHQNEHLIAIPKMIYWGNIAAFGGSNITLGILVWGISLATAFLVACSIRPQISRMPRPKKVAVAWIIGLYAFPYAAAHNYLFSMSGSAWILANFFALSAITALNRGHPEVAGVLGVLGTFTYGTGLAIWPALAVVVVLRRRFFWREAMTFAFGAAAVVVERLTAHSVDHHPALTFNPLEIVRSMAMSAGALYTQEAVIATLVGLLGFAFATWLAVRLYRGETPTTAALTMVGLAAYCLAVFLMFAVTRAGFSQEMLMSSRYMAVASLFALSVSVLALLSTPTSFWIGWIAAVLGVIGAVGSLPTLHSVQVIAERQDVGAVSARLELADGRVHGYTSNTGDILRSLDHYPFNERFRDDCGLFGDSLSAVEEYDPEVVAGYMDESAVDEHPSGVDVQGWAYAEESIECILIVDAQDMVVGAAIHGYTREDVRRTLDVNHPDLGWIGVAQEGGDTPLRAVVRVEGMDSVYELKRSDGVNS